MKYFISTIISLLSIQSAFSQIDLLRINQLQVIGSHNSYKRAIDPQLFKMLSKRDSVSMSKIEYSHVSLTEQLNLGLCNLEIDVYSDTAGGGAGGDEGPAELHVDERAGQPRARLSLELSRARF